MTRQRLTLRATRPTSACRRFRSRSWWSIWRAVGPAGLQQSWTSQRFSTASEWVHCKGPQIMSYCGQLFRVDLFHYNLMWQCAEDPHGFRARSGPDTWLIGGIVRGPPTVTHTLVGPAIAVFFSRQKETKWAKMHSNCEKFPCSVYDSQLSHISGGVRNGVSVRYGHKITLFSSFHPMPQEYLSVLYLKPRTQIILRGKKVMAKLISKRLVNIEHDVYNPQFNVSLRHVYGCSSVNTGFRHCVKKKHY